ncbi:MAG TPA: hypothetical protein PLN13_03125 [Bacteroidia bacterium]|nr:hypothetical protein [Bacteroidia bacterium]HRH07545.1 hypothetical protein [Bacteroidia bacterium]
MSLRILQIIVFLFSYTHFVTFAQESDEETYNEEETTVKSKRFHAGIYVGSYFANNKTAYVYDGYGFDLGGQRNTFYNSFMYTKIINQYGGYNGQQDLIAEALGVQHGDWVFTESDMPVNMRYNIAFNVGLNGRFSVRDNGAIIINANASQLTAAGNFTITTVPRVNSNNLQKTVNTFAINGGEQRLAIQVGYQHLTGEADEKVNFIVEGGLNATFAKFDKNAIQINSLTIDLTTYYDPNLPNATAASRRPGGVGFGAFAGVGFNFNVNAKTKIQLLYSPTYEQIKVEVNPPPRLQNAIGLRLFYGL